eukprot:UN21780
MCSKNIHNHLARPFAPVFILLSVTFSGPRLGMFSARGIIEDQEEKAWARTCDALTSSIK